MSAFHLGKQIAISLMIGIGTAGYMYVATKDFASRAVRIAAPAFGVIMVAITFDIQRHQLSVGERLAIWGLIASILLAFAAVLARISARVETKASRMGEVARIPRIELLVERSTRKATPRSKTRVK